MGTPATASGTYESKTVKASYSVGSLPISSLNSEALVALNTKLPRKSYLRYEGA
jgi:hypothetical protein